MTRKYDYIGKQMVFNFQAFNFCFNEYKKDNKLKTAELEEKIAGKLCVSVDTVHNWHCKKNAPMDLKTIELISKFFELNCCDILLQEKIDDSKMSRLSDRQLTATKNIYDKIVWYLKEFKTSGAFCCSYCTFQENSKLPLLTAEGREKIENMIKDVISVYEQELFDLHNHPIYEELQDFIFGNMTDYTLHIFDKPVFNSMDIIERHYFARNQYDALIVCLNEIIDRYY